MTFLKKILFINSIHLPAMEASLDHQRKMPSIEAEATMAPLDSAATEVIYVSPRNKGMVSIFFTLQKQRRYFFSVLVLYL